MLLFGMMQFISSNSESDDPESPEWLNDTCGRVVRSMPSAFRGWHRLASPTSHDRFVQSKNRCLLVLKGTKGVFVPENSNGWFIRHW